MEFNLNFDIPDENAWLDHIDSQNLNVSQLLKEYEEYKLRIEKAYNSETNKEFFIGFNKLYKKIYLLKILTNEGNVDKSVTIEEIEKCLQTSEHDRNHKKIINLSNAYDTLFTEILNFSNKKVKNISSDFICEIHKIAMHELIQKSGNFRTNWVRPSGEDWDYLEPHNIEKNLMDLCNFVCKKSQTTNTIIDKVKLSSLFLVELLQIHPFQNGNGRISRLFLSWLLIDVCPIPVSLIENQDIFLHCLRDARYKKPTEPKNLSKLILISLITTLRLLCVLLDI